MASDHQGEVTLKITVDVSELEELSKRLNVLTRISTLEVDLQRTESRLGELERLVTKMREPRGL